MRIANKNMDDKSANLRKSFLDAIYRAYRAYEQHGARSMKKLVPIHVWFADKIVSGQGDEYLVRSVGRGGEYTVEGAYYPKTMDIAVFINRRPVVVMSFKFATSNYAQNSNNYFENLLGEAANIKRKGIRFVHFLVLRGHTPYYRKAAGNERGREERIEKLSEHNVRKYIKLDSDDESLHRPDVLGMAIVDFAADHAHFTNLCELGFSEETRSALENDLSIEAFFKAVQCLCDRQRS